MKNLESIELELQKIVEAEDEDENSNYNPPAETLIKAVANFSRKAIIEWLPQVNDFSQFILRGAAQVYMEEKEQSLYTPDTPEEMYEQEIANLLIATIAE
jgi:hypothetical protein